jgi:hypothetical protein
LYLTGGDISEANVKEEQSQPEAGFATQKGK